MKKEHYELFYLAFPYLLLIGIVGFSNPWFLFWDKKYFIGLDIGFLFLQILFFFHRDLHFQRKRVLFALFSFFSFFSILAFPVMNLNLGDGIILLESMYLESSIYGYQLILDEILEGLLHSLLHSLMNTDNPRLAFRILSSLSGMGLILYLIKKYFPKRNGFLSFFVIVSSGGFLLFYGYVENYTLLSLYLFGFSFFVMNKLSRGEKIDPWLLGFLAGLGALFHLVFGYMAFALIYLNRIFSERRDFWKNAFLSSLSTGLVLVLFYGYFFFFSDLRLDISLGHLTNPKFYPIKRLISTQHLKEILYCLLFSALPSTVLIGYVYFFDRETWDSQKSNAEFRFLGFMVLGFLLHGFIFNPQLGFPADWDLMSFYWIPLSLMAARLIQITKLPAPRIFTALLFSFSLLLVNARVLSVPQEEKEEEVTSLIHRVDTFAKEYKSKKDEVPPMDRKFHLKTDFFFFRTISVLKEKGASEDLLQTGLDLKLELDSRKGDFSKTWKKDYLQRATKYHEDYLQFLQTQD